MDALDCIISRRSIRKFTNEAVSEATLEAVVAAAAYAPSWKNTQTTRYVAITDPEVKAKIADDCVLGFPGNARNIHAAPMLIVLTSVSGRSGYERDGSFTTQKQRHWESFDAGIAAEAFCLAAHAHGLGTVIMGIFDPYKVASAARIPNGQSVSALIALGHPAIDPKAPKRKAVDELLTYCR